jgi:ABC-2 type transport system permease protein
MTYGLATVGRMEWIKLRSLRSTWWLLAGSVLAMAAAGAGVGIGYRGHEPLATTAQIVNNSLSGAVLAQLLIGALGILTVTGDYSSGLARATFAAVPRRRLVLTVKAAVAGAGMFAVGLVGSLVGFLSGQVAIAGTPIPSASLFDPTVLRMVLLTAAYLGLVGLLGTGLGVLVRHTGAATGVLFAGLFVSMVAAGMLGPDAMPVTKFVPMIMLVNSIAVMEPGLVSPWVGIGVMALYAGLALGAGAVLLTRRDV